MAAEWTRRKANFGRFMKAVREGAEGKPTPEKVAPKVKTTRTTITRMESGHSLPNYPFVSALLGIYKVTDGQRDEAERLWDIAKLPGTIIEHSADQPPKYRAFRKDETEAARERTMQPVAVPGLLQAAGYASAVAEAASEFNHGRPEGWETRASAERQSRQQILYRENPLVLHAIIGEHVVRSEVGGPEVMADQLRHLLTMIERENITVQVVPTNAGAWSNMSGPAIILDFPDQPDPSSVYLEHAAGGSTVDNPDDVAAFVRTFERVSRDVALSPDESAELIRAVLGEPEGR